MLQQIYQLVCPSCKNSIYFPCKTPEKQIQIICSSCNYKYGFIYGKLSHLSSKIILEKEKGNSTLCTGINYTLYINLVSGEVKRVKFYIPGILNNFSIKEGDNFSIFCTLQKNNDIEDIISVCNETIEETCKVNSPGNKAKNIGLLSSVVIVGVGTLLTTFISGSLALFPLIVSIPVALYTGFTLFKLRAPKVFDRLERTHLVREQKMLTEIHSIQQRLKEIQSEYKKTQESINALKLVEQKMLNSANRALYQQRIEAKNSRITELNKLLIHIQTLETSYSALLEILDIEYCDHSVSNIEVDNISFMAQNSWVEINKLEDEIYKAKLLIEPTKLSMR